MTTATATIAQIAKDLVAHCNTEHEDMIAHDCVLWDKHFAPDFISIEGDGKTYQGRDAMIAKYKEWQASTKMHSCKVTGPFLGQDSFSVIFEIDMESNTGEFPRMTMQEVAIYTVKDNKVVKEEFCYPCPDC